MRMHSWARLGLALPPFALARTQYIYAMAVPLLGFLIVRTLASARTDNHESMEVA
jgi:hypothetical protein